MPSDKCKVIFFGTPKFAVPALEALIKADFCDIVAVVTQPDKPVGRHRSKLIASPVKMAAQDLKIAVYDDLSQFSCLTTTPNPSSKRRGIKSADLGILVAYGEILPKSLLDHFPLGIVNIHPSLLPKYRGPSPIQTAILNRDQETGVSIIKLDEGMDSGPIIAQEKITLDGTETSNDLHQKLFNLGAALLIKILPDYISGKIKPIPQDESLASYTKKLAKEDGRIDWTRSPDEIEAFIRAMNPWPGAWTMWKEKKLIVWRAALLLRPAESAGRDPLYNIMYKGLLPRKMRGRSNNILQLEEVQLEGKQRMPFKEFLKGHPNFTPPFAKGGVTLPSSSL